MATEARDTERAAIAVHEALEAVGVPHAIGGAIALAHYGVPRPTTDIDVNVFLPAEGWPQVRDALTPLGVEVEADPESIERDGEVRLPWDPYPLHLFFSTDELHEAMRNAVRQVPVAGTTIPLVSPEHLVIRKALLDRPKDRLDAEQLLAAQPLDLGEIESWLERMGIREDWPY